MSILRKHSEETTADRLAVPPNFLWLIPMGIASMLLGAITIGLLLAFTLESLAVGLLLMCLLVLPTVISVCFRPITLALDPEQGVINSSTLLGVKRSIRVDDLVGFSSGYNLSVMNIKSRILYHTDGRHTDLSEFTLKSIDNLEGFLQRSGVPYLGIESSFFPFGKFKYRYDPK